MKTTKYILVIYATAVTFLTALSRLHSQTEPVLVELDEQETLDTKEPMLETFEETPHTQNQEEEITPSTISTAPDTTSRTSTKKEADTCHCPPRKQWFRHPHHVCIPKEQQHTRKYRQGTFRCNPCRHHPAPKIKINRKQTPIAKASS